MSSPSQNVLRVVIAAVSVGLALLAALTAPLGSLFTALVLVALTPFVVLDPGSRLTALLVGLHGVSWLASTTAPSSVRDWVLTIAMTLGLLTIHLAASLASALPRAAPVPRASLLRWGRRAVTVVGLSVPVWALLVAQSASPPAGDAAVTYAALAALALLGLSFWLAQLRPEGGRRPP